MLSYLDDFCNLFYLATAIPISYYNTEADAKGYFPDQIDVPGIFRNTLPGFSNLNANPDYFVSDSFSYYGCVRSETEPFMLFIGPVYSTPVSDATIRNFMKEWAISPEHKAVISEYLLHLPVISFNRFQELLGLLYCAVNQKPIDIIAHFHINTDVQKSDFSDLHSKQVYEAKENRIYHNTWHFEQKLMNCIQQGDVDSLNALLQIDHGLDEGIVADNALRQHKNIFISIITLATRSAINGGMDIEQAYQLSDLYIQECERTTQISAIANLEYTMLVDFCKRVSQNKIPQGMSPEIFECIQYINRHINDPVQVGDVADHIARSRSYTSEKFKKELGFNLNSFITRRKLEEAKSLLTYSDKSLSEISTYLCFSSQSYFQNLFKKTYGVTPRHYREQHRRH
ncbi:MAG: helix-turn-helix domain-containing protein [Eubacteriales bacterium]|nr:helix-turn-helix domain-containing protein [Eubacteriales bacterium]